METRRLAPAADPRSPLRRLRVPPARSAMSVSFVQSLKNNWRELLDGTPGKRFQDRYEKKKRDGQRGGGRTLKLVAAALLIVVGVVLLVIPGPGTVFIALGGALLAEESATVARALDWTETRIRRLFRRRH